MEVVFKIDNSNQFEQQLFDFLREQKQELEEVTLDGLKNFINSFQKEKKLHYKKKDIRKHLSTITSDNDEPRDESVELYSHVEDSGQYIHDLRRVKNR